MFLDDIVSPLTIEEAKSQRMSAQMKLSRAWDREQQKSTASRERGKEVMAQARADAEKKAKEQDVKEAGNPAQQAAIAIAMKKAGKKPKQVDEAGDRVDPILIKALNRMPDGLATHREVLDAAYDAYTMEVGKIHIKQNYGVTNAYIPQLLGLYKDKHGLTFNEEYTPAPVKPPRSPRGFNKQGTGLGNKLADLNRKEWEEKKKKEQGVAEGKADYNFDIEDLKRLERIRDLATLKAQALALISKPSAKPMRPEKVEWFKNALERMNSPMKVIKMMYDLMLSGEGNAVIGTKSSMNPNNYRQRFGEQGVAEGSEEYCDACDRVITKKPHVCPGSQGVAEGDREFRNQERNAGIEAEDHGTYSIWTQGSKDLKPKCIVTKQCSMDDAERHARSIKKKYPFLKVWMQAHHLGKSGFFPMNEDSWSDGQGQWSSEHDQWTKESLEPQNDSKDAVYNAILRRIIGGHASLLGQYGPERVMAAAEDVAEWNSDVEEIGTSDVSGWVRQVFQKLQNNEY